MNAPLPISSHAPITFPPCWPCEDDSCSWEVRTSEERCCGKPSIPCDARLKLPESAMWVWGPYPGLDKPPPVVDVLVTIPLLTALTWTQSNNNIRGTATTTTGAKRLGYCCCYLGQLQQKCHDCCCYLMIIIIL